VDEISRRSLLQVVGASAAVAGAEACSRGPREYIVPYVNQPPEITPSVSTMYATTMSASGYGIGMVVECHEGRPTKAEGNPHHPASLGALGMFEQASILSLYDPARARMILRSGAPATWSAFLAAATGRAPVGKHTHVLLEPTSAPHLVDLIERMRRRGDVVVHFDSPLARSNVWRGARLSFGRVLEPRWSFGRADVVLALDADFLSSATTPMAWTRAWAKRRQVQSPSETMSRLYIVEARMSVTGMAADERLRVQSSQVPGIAADILAALIGQDGASVPAEVQRAGAARAPSAYAKWVGAVARDLRAHARSSLVVAGDVQPPEVHALAHAMNQVLGGAGQTVTYAPSPIFEAGEESHGLEALTAAMDEKDVATLLIAGGDPVYTAPADLDFDRRMRQVPTTAYLGPYENHTARASGWFVPEAHGFEAWGDARAFDGSRSIAQPLIRPLIDGKTAAQLLAAWDGHPDATSRDLVREAWRAKAQNDFDGLWQRALVTGVVENDALTEVDGHLDWRPIAKALATPSVGRAPLEVVYFADSKVHDGRYAENAWLQETPDPVTKLTWDNAALVSPATSSRLKIESEDVVELVVRGRKLRSPVLVVPGMADDVVGIALGYGQTTPARLSYGVGANGYLLRDSRAPWSDDAVLHKLPGSWDLALTQQHWTMEGRPLALSRTLAEYRNNRDFAKERNETPRFLYELKPTGPHQWGMTIDLNACTGCSACVVACIAENNIPTVGKTGVRLSREMHWLRIDRYFEGDMRAPTVVVQPILCQHCEKAPCEYVCPVNATVHSHDGLNEMVYNRCVGTRFCSNNCPYKVRRFNFFNYSADKDPQTQLAMNPDVTVRARGVMEKCTYCVQRIREVEIRARREERPIRDGEIQTACQQTCPTGAIVFGDIADPSTRVSESRQNERLYQVLHELGTLPRTRYVARVTNPNPELAGG
jgi:Fe-S-cluster-containing dehydrogenase component